MKYVDAGYAICLAVLFLYAVSLVARRRRLERAAAVRQRDAGLAGSPVAADGRLPTGPTGGAVR